MASIAMRMLSTLHCTHQAILAPPVTLQTKFPHPFLTVGSRLTSAEPSNIHKSIISIDSISEDKSRPSQQRHLMNRFQCRQGKVGKARQGRVGKAR